MVQSYCNPFRRRRQNTRDATWRDLLSARGEALWSIRAAALGKVETSSTGITHLPVSRRHRKQNVCVFSNTALFQKEEENGVDKINSSKVGIPQPLTETTGKEWERQRSIITGSVLCDIKERSLEASKAVTFDEILNSSDGSTTIDLKQTILQAVLGWVVRLFRGHDDVVLADTFFSFWQEIRAFQKNNKRIRKAKVAFVAALKWDGGLLQSFRGSRLSAYEATANCGNAMVAAFETTSSLVFWTLWSCSRTPNAWNKCRSQDIDVQDELHKLAALKKKATEGKPIELTGLSYLGCALAETIRVFPPVWTLPRSWPKGDAISAKFDVLAGNLAQNMDWNPDRRDSSASFTSFGVGKRSCPAGTAALFAAHTILRRFVLTFDKLEECDPDKVLRSAYLSPTLSVQGPQLFRVSYSS